jgi:hypothetical protein
LETYDNYSIENSKITSSKAMVADHLIVKTKNVVDEKQLKQIAKQFKGDIRKKSFRKSFLMSFKNYSELMSCIEL